MKILVDNYTIDSEVGYIQLSHPAITSALKIESLLLITKVSSTGNHTILYNFATYTGTWFIDTNRIYLDFVTSLLPTDKLQIYYDATSLDSSSTSLVTSNSAIQSNTATMSTLLSNIQALITTVNDLTDSVYNVTERLRALDAVRDNTASIRVITTGGSISQLSGIIGDFTSTSTTAGYLRVGALTSQHNSAAQININNIVP